MLAGVREHLRAAFTGREDAEDLVQQDLKAPCWRLEQLGLRRASRDDADTVAVQAVQRRPGCVCALLVDLECGNVGLCVERRRVGSLGLGPWPHRSSRQHRTSLWAPSDSQSLVPSAPRSQESGETVSGGKGSELWHYQDGTFSTPVGVCRAVREHELCECRRRTAAHLKPLRLGGRDGSKGPRVCRVAVEVFVHGIKVIRIVLFTQAPH